MRVKANRCGTIGADDDMLLSLVLLLLTTLFLLSFPCDWGKEAQHRVTPSKKSLKTGFTTGKQEQIHFVVNINFPYTVTLHDSKRQ